DVAGHARPQVDALDRLDAATEFVPLLDGAYRHLGDADFRRLGGLFGGLPAAASQHRQREGAGGAEGQQAAGLGAGSDLAVHGVSSYVGGEEAGTRAQAARPGWEVRDTASSTAAKSGSIRACGPAVAAGA